MNRTVEKRIKSAIPLYATTGAIVVFGLIFPLYRIWGIILTAVLALAVYFIARRFCPDRIVKIELEPEYKTGIAELDAALNAAAIHIKSLRELDKAIADEHISSAIVRMVTAGDAILDELMQKPDKARSMRRFLTYYLPTAEKLMASYAKQENGSIRGDNSNEIKTAIENNADTIARAFETSLDSLYAGEALDITSDIDVLDSMVNNGPKL